MYFVLMVDAPNKKVKYPVRITVLESDLPAHTWCSAGTLICRLVVFLVPTGDNALVDPMPNGQTRFDGTRAVH